MKRLTASDLESLYSDEESPTTKRGGTTRKKSPDRKFRDYDDESRKSRYKSKSYK